MKYILASLASLSTATETSLGETDGVLPATGIKLGTSYDTKVVVSYDKPDNHTDAAADKFGMISPYSRFNLQGYGCWCRGPHWEHGKGQAVDGFDDLCRKQHHNYDCLQMDDETCDGITTRYDVDLWMVDREVFVECINDPVTESCKAKTCMIDVQIVKEFVALTKAMNFPIVSEYGHYMSTNGFFDPAVECPRGDNSVREKQCCGSFPFREWFLKNGDAEFRTRECCEYDDIQVQADWRDSSIKRGRYYDSSIEVCCADGVAVIGGRCG